MEGSGWEVGQIYLEYMSQNQFFGNLNVRLMRLDFRKVCVFFILVVKVFVVNQQLVYLFLGKILGI